MPFLHSCTSQPSIHKVSCADWSAKNELQDALEKPSTAEVSTPLSNESESMWAPLQEKKIFLGKRETFLQPLDGPQMTLAPETPSETSSIANQSQEQASSKAIDGIVQRNSTEHVSPTWNPFGVTEDGVADISLNKLCREHYQALYLRVAEENEACYMYFHSLEHRAAEESIYSQLNTSVLQDTTTSKHTGEPPFHDLWVQVYSQLHLLEKKMEKLASAALSRSGVLGSSLRPADQRELWISHVNELESHLCEVGLLLLSSFPKVYSCLPQENIENALRAGSTIVDWKEAEGMVLQISVSSAEMKNMRLQLSQLLCQHTPLQESTHVLPPMTSSKACFSGVLPKESFDYHIMQSESFKAQMDCLDTIDPSDDPFFCSWSALITTWFSVSVSLDLLCSFMKTSLNC